MNNRKKSKTSISIDPRQLKKMKNDILLNNNKDSLSTTIEYENNIYLCFLESFMEEIIDDLRFDEFLKIARIVSDNISYLHKRIFKNNMLLKKINIILYKLMVNLNTKNNNEEEIMELHDIAKKIMGFTNNQVFALIWFGIDYYNENSIKTYLYYKSIFITDKLAQNEKWEIEKQLQGRFLTEAPTQEELDAINETASYYEG